ncbi:MAG: carbohydrate binding family 9 domain-containing protein, partial [Acidobacteria bacterium]|nr:carbohydrate binding family 9 domain-containing protein [Acidobacteriota bacterium]
MNSLMAPQRRGVEIPFPPESRADLRTLGRILVALSFLAAPRAGWSQSVPTHNKKIAYAKRTESKITIDGALTEPAWQTAEPLKDFIQREPTEGTPASEWTEVRLLYDNDNLYVSAYCHDRTPQKIVINDIRRDFGSHEQDYFGVLLDTFNDDRNGYLLLTTPIG